MFNAFIHMNFLTGGHFQMGLYFLSMTTDTQAIQGGMNY